MTALLQAWSEGDLSARDRLIPFVYQELRRLAHRALGRERRGQALQTTELVHEAYLRLVGQDRARWANRSHFLAIAAQAMRRVLVDQARRRAAAKRGGGEIRVALEDAPPLAAAARDAEVLALDEVLGRLEALDPPLVRLVELRYFAGLSVAETAEALAISPATVGRQWNVARAWLHRELKG